MISDDDEEATTDQPTVDAGNPDGIKKQRRTQKRAEEESRDFWMRVFNDPVGRREMWGLLNNDLHAFTQIFSAGPTGVPDQYATWYQRGQQDFGLKLYHRWLEMEPEGIQMMHRENDSRFQKRKPRTKPDGA